MQSPASFWAALSESRELIRTLRRDRGWPLGDMLSLSRIDGWADVCDAGGFLTDPGAFDPVFFNIGQLEATVTSPQIRLAMKTAWKALENSGINPAELDGRRGGCFVGMSQSEYGPPASTADDYTGHRTVGMGQLGVRGPHLALPRTARSVDQSRHSLRIVVDRTQMAATAVRDDDASGHSQAPHV